MEILTWKKVRGKIKNINRRLFKLIDTIDPPDNYTFIRTQHPFGDLVVNHGNFCAVPDNQYQDLTSYSAITCVYHS